MACKYVFSIRDGESGGVQIWATPADSPDNARMVAVIPDGCVTDSYALCELVTAANDYAGNGIPVPGKALEAWSCAGFMKDASDALDSISDAADRARAQAELAMSMSAAVKKRIAELSAENGVRQW